MNIGEAPVFTRPSADELNAALERGKTVIVATYCRATRYTAKNAGWFTERNGSLHVRYGRGHNCLSIGDRLVVAVRIS